MKIIREYNGLFKGSRSEGQITSPYDFISKKQLKDTSPTFDHESLKKFSENPENVTQLFTSLPNDHQELFRFLIQNDQIDGIDFSKIMNGEDRISCCNVDNLSFAFGCKNPKISSGLIARGEIPAEDIHSALIMAIESHEHINPECFKSAISEIESKSETYDEFKNYLNRTDSNGKTLLHHVAKYSNLDTSAMMMKELVSMKADIDIPDNNGNRPIHFSCMTNNINGLDILIKNGSDLNATNQQGISPLRYSILSNSNHTFDKMLRMAQIGEINIELEGMTNRGLHSSRGILSDALASDNGYALTKLLKEDGISINEKNLKGQNIVLETANRYGDGEMQAREYLKILMMSESCHKLDFKSVDAEFKDIYNYINRYNSPESHQAIYNRNIQYIAEEIFEGDRKKATTFVNENATKKDIEELGNKLAEDIPYYNVKLQEHVSANRDALDESIHRGRKYFYGSIGTVLTAGAATAISQFYPELPLSDYPVLKELIDAHAISIGDTVETHTKFITDFVSSSYDWLCDAADQNKFFTAAANGYVAYKKGKDFINAISSFFEGLNDKIDDMKKFLIHSVGVDIEKKKDITTHKTSQIIEKIKNVFHPKSFIENKDEIKNALKDLEQENTIKKKEKPSNDNFSI